MSQDHGRRRQADLLYRLGEAASVRPWLQSPELLDAAIVEIHRLSTQYRRTRQTNWQQKKELRQLNRSMVLAKHAKEVAQEAAAFFRDRAGAERVRLQEYMQTLDYRPVCRCWSCRLRAWWLFRSGETDPGKPGWRFPWVKRRVTEVNIRIR